MEFFIKAVCLCDDAPVAKKTKSQYVSSFTEDIDAYAPITMLVATVFLVQPTVRDPKSGQYRTNDDDGSSSPAKFAATNPMFCADRRVRYMVKIIHRRNIPA